MPKDRTKCPKCGAWNIAKIKLQERKKTDGVDEDGTILLVDVPDVAITRYATGPWDANFANPPGIPIDAVALIGGAPGAGKSTAALQWCAGLTLGSGKEVLYLCAEESSEQIKARAVRLGVDTRTIRIVPIEHMAQASIETILEKHAFGGVVLDSIAGFTNEPEQAVEIVSSFKFYASLYKCPFLVINHVTKDGDMAGMMKLQHAGDISLMLTKLDRETSEDLENDERGDARKISELRELYTEKSRYGPSGVTSHYWMTERGLEHAPGKENREAPMLSANTFPVGTDDEGADQEEECD